MDLSELSVRDLKEERLGLLLDKKRRKDRRKFYDYYPDEDVVDVDGNVLFYRRDLYPKHLEFFEAGATYTERCAMAANRVGKTEGMGGYETTCHLTGDYPDWWIGRRFPKPVKWWASGKTNETTRDILMPKLFGPIAYDGAVKTVSGTGLIPGDLIGRPTWKKGLPDLIDTVLIKHKSGGHSVLGIKSYQQGRGAFEGTEQDGIWLDEEPPKDIYEECLFRTATTKGLMMLTFTPLEGMSEVVMSFMPKEMRPDV